MHTLVRGMAPSGFNQVAGEMNCLLMSVLILVGTRLLGVEMAAMSLTLVWFVEVSVHATTHVHAIKEVKLASTVVSTQLCNAYSTIHTIMYIIVTGSIEYSAFAFYICSAAAAHSVRLVNGSSPAEGRVEVFYQGKWGTVCGTNATFDLAIVVCRQLGYRETVALKTNASFGSGSGPVWLEPSCYAGINSTVVDCIHAGWGETDCDHSQDVGVVCSGEPIYYNYIK